MPRYIVHHEGLFFEWTTVSDGPTTCAMTREEFTAHHGKLHGSEGLKDLGPRLDRAEKTGTSLRDSEEDARSAVAINTLGEDGGPAPFEEVVCGVVEAREVYGLPLLPDRK